MSNFNGARFLPRLLETLRAQRGIELEVIVVDRHSRDDSRAILAAHQWVRVVTEPPESGLVSGYAVGATLARHEILFFCNEDMWFDPDCLRLLERHIDVSRGLVAADPWQWTYDGSTWIHGGTRFRRCRWNLNCSYPFRQNDFTQPLTDGMEVPFPCAGAFLIHRDSYNAVGGWDRDFFLDHEDIDLFIRIWQAGWRCVTVPEAKVYHAVNASNTQRLPSAQQRVGRRRYIGRRANFPIIGLKYFTSFALLLPFLAWSSALVNNLARCRLRSVWLDFLSAREFVRRARAALQSRRRRGPMLRARPGQDFFREPRFNVASEGQAVEMSDARRNGPVAPPTIPPTASPTPVNPIPLANVAE